MASVESPPPREVGSIARLHHNYRVFGLIIGSHLELPELASITKALPDVLVTVGGVPRRLDHPSAAGPLWEVDDEHFLLRIPGVAAYLVTGGRTVTIEPHAGVVPGDVRLYLLGTALGALLHQRRMLPLHAATALVKGRAVAFAGESGAGKSTLVAHLGERGYPILSDDVTVVTLGRHRRPVAHAGVRLIKLWADALQFLGCDSRGLLRDHSGLQKFHLPINGLDPAVSFPLREVYVLTDGPEVTLRRLSGLQSVAALARNTYRLRIGRALGSTPSHFEVCTRISQTASVKIVRRPRTVESIPELLDRLETEWGTTGR